MLFARYIKDFLSELDAYIELLETNKLMHSIVLDGSVKFHKQTVLGLYINRWIYRKFSTYINSQVQVRE